MILQEFDPSKEAVINVEDVIDAVPGMPEIGVSCYSRITLERIASELNAVRIASTSTANGETDVYKAVYKGKEIALFMMDVGAPMSVTMLEDVFAMGVQKVIVFGSCGVLDRKIDDCSVIIPNRAVRDEGTSYHYAPPADEIEVNENYLDLFTKMLEKMKVHYTIGKVWTTDAFYRETVEKVSRRKENGCICVDMECSANAAAAKFRGRELFQFFYAADNLDAEQWDVRSLGNDQKLTEKDRIATIALELAVQI